jgi:hypothetical protein
MELQLVEEKMVRVEIELSKLEIAMFINCIEAAIDTRHARGRYLERAKEIKKQLNKYLQK